MKKTILFLAAMCITLMTFAIPAKRIAITLTQPDGTKITAFKCGDEHAHFYVDTEGDMLIKNAKGFFVKATPEESNAVRERWNEKLSKRNEVRVRKANARKTTARREFGMPTSYSGKKKGLVILVNFKDKAMKSTNTREAFDARFNQEGYNKNNHVGSVHDYFFDQSYGKFDLTFDVVGPVTVSQGYAYYGKNDAEGQDTHPGTLVTEACKLVNSQVNFKDYDWDGDGEVDQVYIIYAGYGEHATEVEDYLWPHEFDLEAAKYYYNDGNGPLTVDGVIVNTYAMSCELSGQRGSTMDGIGTACHEFSHCLGFPDFYDTSYNGGFGMNAWDVLDAGSYNGYSGWGEAPCGFTAYERNFAGWLEFTELTDPCTIKDMPSLLDKPVAYKIYNDNYRNEYFILENRQNFKWFAYVNGSDATTSDAHGMLLYHVDYDKEAWIYNEPNIDAKHQRMSIVPADKSYGTFSSAYGVYSPTASQLKGDLFPGTKSVTAFNNTSHTAVGGKLFNRNTDGTYNLNKPITNITESLNGLISFDFMGGDNAGGGDTPGGDEETQGDIAFYLQEKMSKMKGLNGSTDIGGELNNYFENSGWIGIKVYGLDDMIKLASSKAEGYIVSPHIATTSSTLNIKLTAMAYNTDNSSLGISLMGGGTVIATKSVMLPNGEFGDCTLTFQNVPNDIQVRIGANSKQRAYIKYIGIGHPASDNPDAIENTTLSLQPAEYFNLSGNKVSAPTTPGIYIIRKGGETKKVYIK